MDNPISKVIGKGMLLIGVVIGLVSAIGGDPLIAIVGSIVAMVGRVIDEYFYDWFDW